MNQPHSEDLKRAIERAKELLMDLSRDLEPQDRPRLAEEFAKLLQKEAKRLNDFNELHGTPDREWYET